MPPDSLGAALPGQLCGPTTLSQAGYAPAFVGTKLKVKVKKPHGHKWKCRLLHLNPMGNMLWPWSSNSR